ncbi:hypothetical protein E2562_033603 [Oryza meyeriana var. granulata]|uniref:Uncharacterized protein n=1 Tax=Oryza meyeriana var. granulata TaxID=110450 RepID=A0A6G1D980_9ORYZ|nr:hypothetical protein E2562_033603 [Oryza meyeriana var. granulata]
MGAAAGAEQEAEQRLPERPAALGLLRTLELGLGGDNSWWQLGCHDRRRRLLLVSCSAASPEKEECRGEDGERRCEDDKLGDS